MIMYITFFQIKTNNALIIVQMAIIIFMNNFVQIHVQKDMHIHMIQTNHNIVIINVTLE